MEAAGVKGADFSARVLFRLFFFFDVFLCHFCWLGVSCLGVFRDFAGLA